MKLRTLFEKRTVLLDPEGPELRSKDLSGYLGRYAVVTDLHIGFEEKFASVGVRIQANADGMLAELEGIIEQNNVTHLVVAGDVKSGIDRILQSEWDIVPRFFNRLLKKCQVSVVPGDHDGGLNHLLPEQVHQEDINGMLLGDTLILHGHTRPLIKFKDCRRMLMGHVHPIFQRKGSPLSGQPVWVFLKVRRKSIFQELLEEDGKSLVEVILMPSFNLDLASTGYVFEEARIERRIAPIVKELRSAEEAVVTTLSGEVIGDESLLPNVL
jgi:uncharacterized protein